MIIILIITIMSSLIYSLVIFPDYMYKMSVSGSFDMGWLLIGVSYQTYFRCHYNHPALSHIIMPATVRDI